MCYKSPLKVKIFLNFCKSELVVKIIFCFRSFAMKAIRVSNFGDESVMKLQETEIMTPEADEVLVKVEAAGINPVDTYIRTGNYLPSRLPKLPYTPGGDVCGTVTAIGK
jgi:NADPH2:quinone reductase